MKKILALLVTATLLGAGGLTIASAAESPGSTSAPSTASPSAEGGEHYGARHALRRLAFTTAADTIGISPTDLLAAMKGGDSIADVATSHDVDPQTVIDAVISALNGAIDKAVSDGKITAEQAATIKEKVASRVPKVVNANPEQLVRRRALHAAVAVSAKTIGVSVEDLRDAIKSGQSVAEVATAHNVDPTTVVNAIVAAGTARIDKAVANHHLSEEQAAKLKASLPERAQRFVDFTRDAAKESASAA
jgi:transposase-like protein